MVPVPAICAQHSLHVSTVIVVGLYILGQPALPDISQIILLSPLYAASLPAQAQLFSTTGKKTARQKTRGRNSVHTITSQICILPIPQTIGETRIIRIL
jgi:hypothetical protein